ncbi:glycoside hydrolase family 31 protein [Cecembia lonarensis]|uniref:Alpha-xylosidase n=1 Tax=Cecembia lonarensis (strain CCUG 58316 / KCTC 22772 / LW9) TaxID=1225176 RepID=K1M269_CECL9|nr:TIM-barrel domain-containing protein [Cecembia lonarensis]EKB50364.1 Alpha-xylosidase [Cecembia lonarensis LW9]
MATLAKKSLGKRNVPIGDVEFWEKTSFGIRGNTKQATFNISVYESSTIRIQVTQEEEFSPNPYAVIAEANPHAFELEESSYCLLLKTEKIHLYIQLQPFSLRFETPEGKIINEDDSAFAVSWLGTEVSTYKQVQENEKFVGLGEKTGNLNRAGKAYVNWNTDYFAYGVGDDPLYMSIPFFIGLHHDLAYGIFFDNSHKTTFNFGASNNRFIYFSADDGDLDYYFMHDHGVGQVIEAYTRLTGTMEMPPIWSLGFQQCRYSYYPESEVLTLAETFRNKNMPADVIYLDIHHMEKYKVFTFDKEKFPDPKTMIRRLKEKGFKVVVIMDPGIKTEDGYVPYEDGKDKDLFVTYPDGAIYEAQVWPGWCAFPDFTKPAVREWWAEKMIFYKDAGVDGYWTDMNEPASWGQFTPNLIDFYYEGEQTSHRKARNVYGMQMARSAMEGCVQQEPEKRPFVLTRSGFSGIQRYAAAWTGDNISSEEHMLAGIRLVNSLGLSGVAFSGYDVGGFAGESTKSLFARWISIAAFSPLFRAHSMINSNDAEPWAFGEEVEEISRNYMKLRYRLLPTIYSAFYKSSKNGQPLAKSLVVDYPFDNIIFDSAFQNQYLFCDAFLIAPVESYKEITKVYLPKGDWYYLYNSKKYHGNQVIYQDCPTSYLPVYVKSGSVIALQSDIQFTGDTHDGILRLHLFWGEETSTYTHYEDDGASLAYKDGQYLKRRINWIGSENALIFEASTGEFRSQYDEIRLYIHGKDALKISLDGKLLDSEKEDIAFLGRLTDFDPLPEHAHPFHSSKEICCVSIPHSSKAFTIQLD